MNTLLFPDWLSRTMTALPSRYSPSTGPLYYGSDLSCGFDMREDYGEVDPSSVQAIGEALTRRLSTPRGMLSRDPLYGLELRSLLHVGMTPQAVRSLGRQIETECVKDDRVLKVDARLTLEASVLGVTLTVTPVNRDQTFELVFRVGTDGQITTLVPNG